MSGGKCKTHKFVNWPQSILNLSCFIRSTHHLIFTTTILTIIKTMTVVVPIGPAGWCRCCSDQEVAPSVTEAADLEAVSVLV